jgi:transcriptional regulator with XRE-family HTH domain
MSPVNRIVQRLLDVRKRRRLSQAQMGARLGITEEAYRALEKGRTIRLEWVTIQRLMLLLRESGLSYEWFFDVPAAGESAPPRNRTQEAEPEPPAPGSPQERLRRALERASATVMSNAVRGAVAARKARRRDAGELVDTVALVDMEALIRTYHRKSARVVAARGRKVKVGRPIPAGSVALLISGESLAPDYSDGDVLICTPGVPTPGKAGVLVLTDRTGVLGVWHDEGGKARFVPLDVDQPVRSPEPGDVAAVFTVERHIPKAEVVPG